jgi:cyclin B
MKKYSLNIKNIPDITKFKQYNLNSIRSKLKSSANKSVSSNCDSIPLQINSTKNRTSESNVFNYNNISDNINYGSAKMVTSDSARGSSAGNSKNASNVRNKTNLNTTENQDVEMKVSKRETIPINQVVKGKPKKKNFNNSSERKPSTAPNPLSSQSNPQLVNEYLEDIYNTIKQNETFFTPKNSYMKDQPDINEKMRAILIDWLVDVHLKFKLVSDTLFLTVNLIDRYLEKHEISRTKLQLVGVTAMLIACKYEEIYAPEVRDFVYITDKAYNKEDILALEKEMLFSLDFNITVPTTYRFLEVFSRYLNVQETYFMFARYLIELFLVEYKMLKYKPSLIASAVLYITFKVTKSADSQNVCKISNYCETDMKDCARDICLILNNSEKNSLQAVRKKFSSPKLLEVAKLKFT